MIVAHGQKAQGAMNQLLLARPYNLETGIGEVGDTSIKGNLYTLSSEAMAESWGPLQCQSKRF